MKTKLTLAATTLLSLMLFVPCSRATWITAIDSGTVPGTNDFVEVDSPNIVTVDTNATTQYIFGSGQVTMAANSTLGITDASLTGTYQLAVLDTSAVGNTVIYWDNPFYAKHQDYYNLIFNNTTTNNMDFY